MKSLAHRVILLSSVLILAASHLSVAQLFQKPLKLDYDVDFSYIFDNREFSAGGEAFTPSCTLHGADLMPSIGFLLHDGNATHRVMAGVDYLHQMGNKVDTHDFILYYDAHLRTPKGSFEGVAGKFPRSFLEGEYGRVFFSDSLRFVDRTLEGLLLKYRRPTFYTELGLDWMGMKGVDVKERFQIVSHGLWNAVAWMDLGWTGSFYHYAGSEMAPGVVDNHIFNPFVRLNAGRFVGIDVLSLKAGPILTYQRDRKREEHPVFPMGVEIIADARYHSLGFENTFYFGDDIMPYREDRDFGGNPYSSALYMSSPFYRGLMDRAELYWEPSLTAYVSLRFGASFFFSRYGYEGCQQLCSILFDLNSFCHRSSVAGRTDSPRRKNTKTNNTTSHRLYL